MMDSETTEDKLAQFHQHIVAVATEIKRRKAQGLPMSSEEMTALDDLIRDLRKRGLAAANDYVGGT